jgi:hypothetical protein
MRIIAIKKGVAHIASLRDRGRCPCNDQGNVLPPASLKMKEAIKGGRDRCGTPTLDSTNISPLRGRLAAEPVEAVEAPATGGLTLFARYTACPLSHQGQNIGRTGVIRSPRPIGTQYVKIPRIVRKSNKPRLNT